MSNAATLLADGVEACVDGFGLFRVSSRYRDFMGWTVPRYSVPQDAVDQLVADRHFGILVSYLRDGDQVFETYWTTDRGNEVMAPSYGLLDLTAFGQQASGRTRPRAGRSGGIPRWPDAAGRPPDRPVVADQGRTQR